MKKLIIVLLTYLQIGNLNAEVDSLNYSIDSNYSVEINSDSILMQEKQITELKQESNKSVNKLVKQTYLQKNNTAKPANRFEDAWDAFTDLFKPVWGHYTEDGFRSEGPYFLFDRTYPTIRSMKPSLCKGTTDYK